MSNLDNIRANNFRERFNYFLNDLNDKISQLLKNKSLFHEFYQNLQNQINSHYVLIIQNKVLEKKRATEIELEEDHSNLTHKLERAAEDANRLKEKIQIEINKFENLIINLNESEKINQIQNFEDFNEDDALMINDSVNEFVGEAEVTKTSNNQLKLLLEDSFSSIESLMNQKLAIDEILKDISSGLLNDNTINFVECLPDLDTICFGHVKKDVTIQKASNLNSSLISPIDLLDHSQFKMETQLNDNFSFKKSEKSYITFCCPDISKQDDKCTAFHNYLTVDLYDSHNNSVPFDLKEKIKSNQRFIRVYFVPLTSGIHKLIIKFKNVNIPNSPFHFVVLPEKLTLEKCELNTSILSSSSFNSSEMNSNSIHEPLFKTPEVPSETILSPDLSMTSEITILSESRLSAPSVVAGRGRLIKMKALSSQNSNNSLFSKRSVISNPVSLSTSISQKRKSPSQINDINNNLVLDYDEEMEDEDNSMGEISSKLKKVVCVNENINQYHNYSMQSISSIMSLNVNVNSNQNINGIAPNPNGLMINLISNHLRKYLNANGLVRLLDDKIPALKAQFQRKFTGCNYPIGVRSCKIRNWLIVCDNGNNLVKVFERTTGELLHQIKDNSEFNFRRPSAILINEESSEIYVKDDKEILVFDLEQDCKLVRKFGYKILSKPYGLAFDKDKNIVLIDADFKKPLIYTFDPITGNVINAQPYQPVLKINSNSQQLQRRFGDQKILSNNLESFEKTKVRFICSNQNSLFASDLGRSIIYKTNFNGEIEMAFGFQGKRKGELNEPSGIFVDNDGEAILVGDSKNNRIQIYDGKGRYKCDMEFLDEKVIRPSDIHVDSEGYLYVSCFIQHCILKFKILSE